MHDRLAVVCNFAPAPATDERIAKVVALMRGAPGDTHSLATLAAEVGLSPSRLQHLTVAAHRAGFPSSAHFSTAFRAMFGLRPSDLVAAGLRRHPH